MWKGFARVLLTVMLRTGYTQLPKVVEGIYETALRNSGIEVELEFLIDILFTIYSWID